MILMPILQLIFFTYAVQSDLNEFPLGWVDSDRSVMSRELMFRIDSSRHFKVAIFINRFEAEKSLLSGKVRAIMVIPPDFEKSIVTLDKSPVQLLIDGSDPNLARSSTGYLQAMVGDFYIDKALKNIPSSMTFKLPIDVRMRMLYNEDLSTVRFMVPGLLVYIVAFLSLVITALTIVKELASGTIEQLFVTPVTRLEVILGKLIPFGFMANLIACLIALAGWLFFRIGPKGSIMALIVVLVLFSLSMLSTGLFVSVIAKTASQASQFSISITIPAMLISGFMFPIFTMPLFYRIVSNFLPITFALKAVRGIYLKGYTMAYCLPYIAILILFSIVQLVFTVRLFNRRLG
jgi:ABC-2 type transport system permease protein